MQDNMGNRLVDHSTDNVTEYAELSRQKHCCFNHGVCCFGVSPTCVRCGWNPAVELVRKRKLRDNF